MLAFLLMSKLATFSDSVGGGGLLVTVTLTLKDLQHTHACVHTHTFSWIYKTIKM